MEGQFGRGDPFGDMSAYIRVDCLTFRIFASTDGSPAFLIEDLFVERGTVVSFMVGFGAALKCNFGLTGLTARISLSLFDDDDGESLLSGGGVGPCRDAFIGPPPVSSAVTLFATNAAPEEPRQLFYLLPRFSLKEQFSIFTNPLTLGSLHGALSVGAAWLYGAGPSDDFTTLWVALEPAVLTDATRRYALGGSTSAVAWSMIRNTVELSPDCGRWHAAKVRWLSPPPPSTMFGVAKMRRPFLFVRGSFASPSTIASDICAHLYVVLHQGAGELRNTTTSIRGGSGGGGGPDGDVEDAEAAMVSRTALLPSAIGVGDIGLPRERTRQFAFFMR